jgi:hypothetical protein
MPFVILPTNSASGGYDITNSLRFNSGSSDYLNRTPASTTNRQTWTWSAWVKRANLSSDIQELFASGLVSGTYNFTRIFFDASNRLIFQHYPDTNSGYLTTTQVFRDTSAWYHIVVVFNSTSATSSDRMKIYVNGSEVTDFTTGVYSTTYPSQNTNSFVNDSTYGHTIGRSVTGYSTYYYNGYMSDVFLIDGQALTPSSFGETDFDTGIWKPKAYTGTFGTNGFYLQFKNSASLGTDSSGNGNTFTVNNLTSIDQTTDTPTNNFATINGVEGITKTLTEGNLSLTGSYKSPRATIGFSKGKWYWECKLITQITAEQVVGICGETFNPANTIGGDNNSWGYIIQSNANNGQVYHNGSTTQYATFTTNDILNVAVDMDNQAIYFGKNGTWQNSGVPTSGSSKTGAIYTNLPTSGFVFPAFDCGTGTSGLISANFGNPPYTGGSNTDGAGYGNFSYAVPSGYYSLNTKNLATFG